MVNLHKSQEYETFQVIQHHHSVRAIGIAWLQYILPCGTLSGHIVSNCRTDKPVVEKLKEEKADLDEKIRKLKTFLYDDEKLSNIGKEQVNLLRCQLEAMEQYSDILWARIDDLEE